MTETTRQRPRSPSGDWDTDGREVLRITETTDGWEVLRMTETTRQRPRSPSGDWDYRRLRSPSDDWDYPATAEKSFGWLRLPTAGKSFGWLRLPTAGKSFGWLRLQTAGKRSFGWLRLPTAGKSFGWLRLPTAGKSFGWLRLPTTTELLAQGQRPRSPDQSDWETEPVLRVFTHAKRSTHRTFMSEFDGLWKHQNNPACTESVSLEPSVLKLDTQKDEEPNH